jgi:hypothetical protein
MKSILDPAFKYVPAASTDLRKTFARVRREQAKVAEEAKIKVTPLKRNVTKLT